METKLTLANISLGHTKKLTFANAALAYTEKLTNPEHTFLENHTLSTSLCKMEPTARVLARLKKERMLHLEHSKLFFMLGNSNSSTVSCI